MSEKKTPAFKGTKEQENELLKVIEKYKDTEGALIPVLHEAQVVTNNIIKFFIFKGESFSIRINKLLMWINLQIPASMVVRVYK